MISCDLAITGGIVVDPASGLEARRTVAIVGNTIVAVTDGPVEARRVLDATGCIVAPGWIDLHSHAQSIAGGRIQARDGVTTALELESGLLGVGAHYAAAARSGRAINYGFATSWQQARMVEVGGLPVGNLLATLQHFGDEAWRREAAPRQVDAMLARLGADLADGALGIGVLMGYAGGVAPDEYLRTSALAAALGRGTFTHARDLVEQVPGTPVDGASEIVSVAETTGVRAHYCHINSSSMRHLDRVHELIARSPAGVTTEAYPYGAGSTAISAEFLAPERLAERDLVPSDILYTREGRRIRNADDLRDVRRADPGAVAIFDFLDEADPADAALLERALVFPGAVVASDAMPFTWDHEGADGLGWPPPERHHVHPRSAGTFSRIFRLVRERGTMSLVEAVGRCSFEPARILEPSVPMMRQKGRVQPGCDADLTVFDPVRVTDNATYGRGLAPSTGYAFVIVGGVVLVDHDVLDPELPGRPVRA